MVVGEKTQDPIDDRLSEFIYMHRDQNMKVHIEQKEIKMLPQRNKLQN